MGPFTKRFSAWLMSEIASIVASRPSTQAVHVGYEKAGRILFDSAVPWNADAVLVEAAVRSATLCVAKSDFTIRLPGESPISAENIRVEEGGYRHRLFFRLPVPSESQTALLFIHDRPLGNFEIPILSENDFLNGLSIESPTIFVTMGSKQVNCQTFVSTQGQGMTVVALLRSRSTQLAPLASLPLEAWFQREDKPGPTWVAPIVLAGSQLQTRQAMVAVKPPKPLRYTGTWQITWRWGNHELCRHRCRIISQRAFCRSLRVSDTRFAVLDRQGRWSLHRQVPPIGTIQRLGPCFVLSSHELGAAGLCSLQVHALVPGAETPPLLFSQDFLVQDGLNLFVPGTVAAEDLMHMIGFELRLRDQRLCALPLSAVPTASFNNEGGFRPAPDFLWTSAADEELMERLTRLIDRRAT